MRKFKKTAACVLAAAMVLSMAGCGNQDKKTTADGSTASVTDAATGSDAVVIEDDGDWSTTEEEVVEDNRFTTVEGADAMGINFDDNELDGFVTYENGGKFSLYAENGEMVADIESVGSLEHACQVYFDGFTMAKGCVYTISFDVRSTIEREVEWRVQINGGDYHAYASNKITLGPETQTITQEFTMDEDSDPAPRFVVNMGAFDGATDLAPHQIYFDNISLFVTDSSNAEQIVGAPKPIQVKVNQIGYKPDDKKTVVVTSKNDMKFKVVKADTEETVYIGEYGALAFDAALGSDTKQGDFSDFKTPGRYKIISSPSGASYEFSIGEGLYDDIYKDVILMLYNQRCGSALDKDISGDFAHDACHMQEAVIYGDDSGKTVDVSGGWHDAGDYGRYVVSGAKTVQDLFLAYEDYGYDADDIGIPESGNGTPDLLDEAKYELDWMLKMQDQASGGVYHKVTGLVFPETVLAVDETEQMVLAPISYTATGDFAAIMAKASVLYKDIDSTYADTCLAAAEKAFAYLEANPDMKGYQNPEDIVTGEYPDSGKADEYLWAAAELYIATQDGKYLDATKAALETNYTTGLGWASVGTYPLYDLAKAEGIDETVRSQAKDAVIEDANTTLAKCKKSNLYVSMKNFPWGSNMVIADDGMLFLMANNLESNAEYAEYAQRQRDYIFGVNGTGYCYVTGYGQLTPDSTHHRPSQVLGKTLPGMLVGGADSNLEDPYANAVLYGIAPALCYVDNSQSFSCNEVTIYWNSPLIYLMTGLE
ncbi:MAG: glycoside hydrolase family 9 protein [Wujia sp.]